VVFTWAEIDDLHARFGRAESLGDYLRALAAIGVVRVELFVTYGQSEFFGADRRRPHHLSSWRPRTRRDVRRDRPRPTRLGYRTLMRTVGDAAA
jgi:hypothetical protein